MSVSSASDGGRKYKPLPAPKRQVNFPPARLTTRPLPPISRLNNKQSSLTQLWDDKPTPKPVIDISSSDDDDEYEDRPAKKRKQNVPTSSGKGKRVKLEERERGQSSFTQIDYLARMRQPPRSTLDEGFQIWQDSETEKEVEESSPAAAGVARVDNNAENEMPEIAESSQDATIETSKDHRVQPSAPKQTWTPQKVRFVEVPSSQTPPSRAYSGKRASRRHRSISRSPLNVRSANLRPPAELPQSPESQDMTMKMLERTRFANQQRRQQQHNPNACLDPDLEQCAAEATDDFSLRTCYMPPPSTRRLQRNTTVQNSQAEDVTLSMAPETADPPPKLGRMETIADSQANSSNETLGEDSQFRPSVRKLKRVATVQDSQCDDLDLEPDDDLRSVEQDYAADTMSGGHDDYKQSNEFHEGTYDPAFSALDRDAIRFTWTQTQQQCPDFGDGSETDDEDLNKGWRADGTRRRGLASQEIGEMVKSSMVEDLIQQPWTTTDGRREVAPVSESEHHASHDDSAYESGDPARTVKVAEVPSSPPLRPHEEILSDDTSAANALVPSSPPPLRASQVSTVVPTQASVAFAPSSPQKKIKAEPFSIPPTPGRRSAGHGLSLLASPQTTNSLWQPDSLSSSPLPLPPWTSSETRENADGEQTRQRSIDDVGGDPQMDSLADFSLPPPPPLSSSWRQTPASSSL